MHMGTHSLYLSLPFSYWLTYLFFVKSRISHGNRKNQEMMSISEKVDKHMKVNPHNGIVYPILKNGVEQHANINMYR